MTVGIIGCGLIGGSIGLALRSEGHKVLGYEPSVESAKIALTRGLLDESVSFEDACKAELVFLCVPPSHIEQTLEKALVAKGPDTVLTDCTSVKGSVVKWLNANKEPNFVPGHPMAGHEKSGPMFASGWMFRGARWILTPCSFTSKKAIKKVEEVVKQLGATPVRLDAQRHDRDVALLSHLPHALAAVLVKMSSDLESTEASGGSWKDLTRVGGVDPNLWTQILMSNRTEVSKILSDFGQQLSTLQTALESNDPDGVHRFFEEAKILKEKNH